MKKIVVMSDNHGDHEKTSLLKELEPDAYLYVHCGDSEADSSLELSGYICVAGNNDWGLDLPRYAQFKVDELEFLVTHGQFYGYFNREEYMMRDLKNKNCDVLLSGHTHIPSHIIKNGYHFINPGSTSWPRGGSQAGYAVIYVNGKNLQIEFKTFL